MTIQEYVQKYLNKPNPASGRGFWTHDEVAAIEHAPVALVQEMQAFASDCYNKKITDPVTIQVLWDKTQAAKAAPKPPIVQPGAGARKIGDLPEGEFWVKLEALLRRTMGK